MSDDLAERLIAASELHGDFVLSSGKRSSTYFDKFKFLTEPGLLKEAAAAVGVDPRRQLLEHPRDRQQVAASEVASGSPSPDNVAAILAENWLSPPFAGARSPQLSRSSASSPASAGDSGSVCAW